MLRTRAAGLLLTLMLGVAPVAAGQSPTDSAKQSASGPTRAWLSLGLGGGHSNGGPIAGRAAASVAVNRTLLFAVEGTAVGEFDHTVDSINLMAGVQTPDPDGFFFVAAGLANTSCGSGCPNRAGVAVDGGYHFGGRYAGVGLVGFGVFAPRGTSSNGIVLSLDLGWFHR